MTKRTVALSIDDCAILVLDVPEGVTDTQVIVLYRQTVLKCGIVRSIYFSELEPLNLKKRKLINSVQAAEIIGITRQAIYKLALASQKPGYKGKFPKPIHTDPNGRNPWFDPKEINNYALSRSMQDKENENRG
ncbi:helix-turn-helix transcriptional regulator [Paenibacillus pinihumi]|uniref:helix-turn-helix transcriptional regulator n=1 Tax=Paenibacillus pinihumi TaxID=669462 RepID=UPI00048F22A9|nr:hypothetical protein [Paenibacillus pinihumi]